MNYFYALILGILSIIGPCTFIMVPVILDKIKTSLFHVVYFFAGILLIFILLGAAASITGIIFTNNVNRYLYLIAGIVTLLSGLKMLGAIRIEYSRIVQSEKISHSFFDGLLHGAVVLGCIGPPLAAVLSFIIVQKNIFNGIMMILFFGLGFILPFFVFGVMLTDPAIQAKILRHAILIQKLGGFLMIGTSTYLLYFAFREVI